MRGEGAPSRPHLVSLGKLGWSKDVTMSSLSVLTSVISQCTVNAATAYTAAHPARPTLHAHSLRWPPRSPLTLARMLRTLPPSFVLTSAPDMRPSPNKYGKRHAETSCDCLIRCLIIRLSECAEIAAVVPGQHIGPGRLCVDGCRQARCWATATGGCSSA